MEVWWTFVNDLKILVSDQDCLAKYFRNQGGRLRQSRYIKTTCSTSQLQLRFWDDAACESRKQFICGYDPEFSCPQGWTRHPGLGTCYWASNVLTSWSSAVQLCKVTWDYVMEDRGPLRNRIHRKYLIRMAHKLFVYILLPSACYVWHLNKGLWLVLIPFPFWADQSQTQIQIVHCLSNSCYCSKLTLISYPY